MMTKHVCASAEAEAMALIMLPIRRRAILLGKLLKGLKGNEADEGWTEELDWRLQDWRAKRRTEPLDELLDGPHERLDELFDLTSGTAARG